MRALRIGIASPYDLATPGGVQEHIRYLAKHLRRRGHHVDIIAPVSDPARLPVVAADGGAVLAIESGVVPVPFGGSIARITLSPSIMAETRELLGQHEYDLIHLHQPTTPALNLALLHQAECPLIGTFHHFSEDQSLAYDASRFVFEGLLDRLCGRIAVSRAARDFAQRYFPGEYAIIPNGIEVGLYQGDTLGPWPEYLNDGRQNILFLGRLEKRKGFEHLLRAFRQVKQQLPNARLLVVGGYTKDDRKLYVEYARHYRLRDVKFIGPVSNEDKVRWFKTADLFCAPSTGGESFGIVLVEAMAAGIPVVASNIRGYNDVIQDGVTGCLVPPGDEHALARTLITVLEDKRLQHRLRSNALAAVRRYDWAQVSQEIESFYYRHIA